MKQYKKGFFISIIAIFLYAFGSTALAYYLKVDIPIILTAISSSVFCIPHMLTGKCPAAVLNSCIKTRSMRPWFLIYKRPWFMIILTSLYFLVFIQILVTYSFR